LLTVALQSFFFKKKRRITLDPRNATGNAGFVYNSAQVVIILRQMYGLNFLVSPPFRDQGVGETLYVSGQVAKQILGGSEAPTIEEEIRCCIKNLKSVLHESGSSMDKVLKTTCLLTDIKDFSTLNTIYSEYFTENSLKPARLTFAAAALPMGAKFEIDCVAMI
jgi:2-iminobutanoate/2-iminopropanoate deaminase